MIIRKKIENFISSVLEIEPEQVIASMTIEDLLLKSLEGTEEKENLPSPRDGLRPSDFQSLRLFMEIEDEFTITVKDEEAQNLCNNGTAGALIHLVSSRIK